MANMTTDNNKLYPVTFSDFMFRILEALISLYAPHRKQIMFDYANFCGLLTKDHFDVWKPTFVIFEGSMAFDPHFLRKDYVSKLSNGIHLYEFYNGNVETVYHESADIPEIMSLLAKSAISTTTKEYKQYMNGFWTIEQINDNKDIIITSFIIDTKKCVRMLIKDATKFFEFTRLLDPSEYTHWNFRYSKINGKKTHSPELLLKYLYFFEDASNIQPTNGVDLIISDHNFNIVPLKEFAVELLL